MGCVSSNLLNHDDDFTQLGSSALSHHIVSLTSTTYGLLTLDPPPPQSTSSPPPTIPLTPPSRFTLGSVFSEPKSLWSDPRPPLLRSGPTEVINSWELMAGLEYTADSFRFFKDLNNANKENSNPNRNHRNHRTHSESNSFLKPLNGNVPRPSSVLDKFERICPPNGENRVVIYTTTLRGVRKTFEACNAVRAVMEGFGVLISERDISMDRGFREQLRELMRGKVEAMVPPRVFVKGRYVGGAEEVLKIVEEGWLGELLEGLPKKRGPGVCEGCGDVRFLPCFRCSGSCKMVMVEKEEVGQRQGRTVVVRCLDCNENGLVLCPICS